MNFISQKLSLLKQKGKQLKNSLLPSNNTSFIIQILPSLYYSPPNITLKDLQAFLISKFTSFVVWDFHQQSFLKYEMAQNQNFRRVFMNQQPVVPLIDLLRICTNTKNKLKNQPQIMRGSECTILLSMYLLLQKKYEYLDEALIAVNSVLKISKDETQYKSQHSYMRNCINLISGIPLNKKSLKLTKITLSHPIKINQRDQQGDIQKFDPCLLVTHLVSEPPVFSKRECILSDYAIQPSTHKIVFSGNIQLTDDAMIIVKHKAIPAHHTSYTCFRLIFNTNFVYDRQIIIGLNEIDVSKVVQIPSGFHIKLQFQEGDKTSHLEQSWKQTKKIFQIQQQKTSESQNQMQKLQSSEEMKSSLSQIIEKKVVDMQDQVQELSKEEITNEQEQGQQSNSPEPEMIIVMNQKVTAGKQDEDSVEDIDDYIKKLQDLITN